MVSREKAKYIPRGIADNGYGGGVNYSVLIKVTSSTGSGSTADQGAFRNTPRRASLALRKCHLMNKIFLRSHLENASARGGLLKL